MTNAPRSARNIEPVQAWRHVAENDPDLLQPLPKIRLALPPQRTVECLDAGEVETVLDWLKDHKPALWPMARLQALCGLRMLEAAALRVQDVDLEARTVTITDTGHHQPKNRSSWRTIPVCGEVIEALQWAMVNQSTRPITGELFPNHRGNLWKPNPLSTRWRKTLRRLAEDTGTPRFARITAHRLRSSFATMAGRLGLLDRIVKAYMGHAPGDMLGGHYRAIGLDELRLVSERMNDWRSPACDAEGRKHFGNIANEGIADG